MAQSVIENGKAITIQPWSPPQLSMLDFKLPPELEASEPPEVRGLARDQVRLMVSTFHGGRIFHSTFRRIPEFLKPGDVLVINTSGTLNAAINATRADGTALELHLSTHLPGDLWVIELRQPTPEGQQPYYTATEGEILALPAGAQAKLLAHYRPNQDGQSDLPAHNRLWLARLHFPLLMDSYLSQYGFPIRYKYVRQGWPISYYQTVYATEAGSAEMPSAGRAFTPELITRLVAQGVQIAPLILHTGVASLEEHEPPYEEYYRVPAVTANLVNNARHAGGRVIAVGTTTVRALETVTEGSNGTHAGEGWTNLVITTKRRLRAIDGLLTGFHEPRSTHLAMLAALAGYDPLQKAYSEALSQGYLWHEFGDLHLLLP